MNTIHRGTANYEIKITKHAIEYQGIKYEVRRLTLIPVNGQSPCPICKIKIMARIIHALRRDVVSMVLINCTLIFQDHFTYTY